ncbi:MAG: mobilization protein [Chitinophagaceae bacterium]|nr:MAG: mobilization protein [Chitinophagaceae bacterium]
MMEGKSDGKKGRGGRPKKLVKRDHLLGIKCTLLERTTIEQKAKMYALTVSDFMRTIAVNYPGDLPHKKVVPKEVLELKGLFNHTAANVNQLVHRHNCGDAITNADRTRLMLLEEKIRFAVFLITKQYS